MRKRASSSTLLLVCLAPFASAGILHGSAWLHMWALPSTARAPPPLVKGHMELRLRQELTEKALAAGNTTQALQMLVEAAGSAQRAQGKTPTVMVTIADHSGVAALLPLFAETLARASPTMAASTVVIAVTKPAFDTCRQHKLLCFHDKEAEERNQELARAGNPRNLPRNKEPLFLQIGWDKLKRLRDALQTGSNILFADMDIAWLQDPLLPLEARGGADLLLTDDGWGPNIGVMYVRPTQCTRLFMEDWLARRSSPEARDQYEFVAAVESAKKKCPTFRVERLEKSEFPNGCCCGTQFPQDRKAGQKWVLWHAACGGDLHSKHAHLTKILEASKNARAPHKGLANI